MSSENTLNKMSERFSECPICKSKADYEIMILHWMIKCKKCQALFMSKDFKTNDRFTELTLLTIPTAIKNEEIKDKLLKIIDQSLPLKFWYYLHKELGFTKNAIVIDINEYHQDIFKLQQGEEILYQIYPEVVNEPVIYHGRGIKASTLPNYFEIEYKVVRHERSFDPSVFIFNPEQLRDLLLTNKRLIFLNKDEIDYEINLDEIKEAYRDNLVDGSPVFRIVLKDRGFIAVSPYTASWRVEGLNMAYPLWLREKVNAFVDRWVDNINKSLLNKKT